MAKAPKLDRSDINQKNGDDKQKAMDDALKKIRKEYGDGAIMKMGEKALTNVEAVPTGIMSLDVALGIGGLPRGRVVEMYGPESSGKTTIALSVVAEVQKRGGIVAYIDAENAMDPKYATALGVNIDELLLSQPDTGEQGLEIADALVSSGAVSLVVVDSVAALVPWAEIEGEMGDAHVGLQARLMSQALRKLTASIFKTQTTVIFINQIREKVGIMFGNPETTPGGRALKFYASVRLEIRRAEQIKDGTEVIGNKTKIKVVKNKVAPPFKVAETVIAYGTGISKVGDLIGMAVEKDIIKKSGSWYSYHDERLGQGQTNVEAFLVDHQEMLKQIETDTKAAYFGVDTDSGNEKPVNQTTIETDHTDEYTEKPEKS